MNLVTTPELLSADTENTNNRASQSAGRASATIRERLRASWRRYRHQQIQRAIRTYSAEKHFLSASFRPVAGPATMRVANGQIERNKLPLNVSHLGPWLPSGPSLGTMMLSRPKPHSGSGTQPMNERDFVGSDLPASLRQSRPSESDDFKAENSPIILVT